MLVYVINALTGLDVFSNQPLELTLRLLVVPTTYACAPQVAAINNAAVTAQRAAEVGDASLRFFGVRILTLRPIATNTHQRDIVELDVFDIAVVGWRHQIGRAHV